MWFHKLTLFLASGFPLLALTPDSVTVTSSTNPSVYGHPVTFTATVSPTGATGKVTFYDGATVLETEPLVTGQASMTTTLLPAGSNAIRAYYSGDAVYAPNSSTVLKQVVSPVPQNGFNLTTSFAPPSFSYPGAVAVADFNGDGKPDLVVANANDSILLGNGDGTFQTPANYTQGISASCVAAGDFNGDGKPDLVVTNANVGILLGDGDGTFQPPAIYAQGIRASCVAVGDFNGDGNADLVITDSSGLEILSGNGDGTFQSPVAYSAGDAATHVAVADFNGDGKTDLAATLQSTSAVAVLLGNGDGTFAAAVTYPDSSAQRLFSVSTGDLNGDGNTDLVVTMTSLKDGVAVPGAGVLLGNGDGTFQPFVNYDVNSAAPVEDAVIGDFNGDGEADILFSGALWNSRMGSTALLDVLYGRGDGTFEPAVPVTSSFAGGFMVSADFDGNGTADLALTAYQLGPFILLGKAAARVALTSSLNPSTVGQSVTLTAAVSPSTATGTVTFQEGNVALGSGSLSSGVVSVSLSNLSVGSHSLTAVYGGDVVNGGNTSPILVQIVNPPSTPSTTSLSSSVNPSGFGQSIIFTATISPATATGTVTFNDGSQTIRTAALVSGTASTTISNLTAGSHAMTAVYSGDLNVAGSASPVLTQVVTAPTTSSAITLTSSLNPSNLGQSVTLTATVSPAAAVGSVTFYNGSTVLGTSTLAGGKASLSTVLLPFGPLALKARYSGGGAYAASYSSVLVQSVKVLLETGFAATVNFNAGSQPFSVTAADFDGDGKPDLAVANRSGNNVSILLGNGDGTFQTAVNYASGTNPECVVTGDFNGDGKSDLAVANYSDNTFSLLLGKGDGTFQTAISYPTGRGPKSLQVADFNGDGLADLAAANVTDGTVSIFAGNGDGTFLPPSTWSTDAGPVSLAVGDFNGDGVADVVTANSSGDDVSILLGKGDGTFNPAVNYPILVAGDLDRVIPTSVTVGDFNGDGRPDLGVGLPAVNEFFVVFSTVAVLIGNGDGTFQNAGTIFFDGIATRFESVAVGDFTGHGIADLAAAGDAGDVVLFEYGPPDFNGRVYPAGDGPISVITGDFNGDGRTDIAVANQNSNDVSILLGTGPSITATTLVSSLNPANYGQSVTLTATISSSTATGAVTFYNGLALLGTAAVSGGIAQLATSALLVGSHSLTAVYGGDANFASSTSAPLIEQINEAASSAAISLLTSSSNPANYGKTITLTATVLPATATGEVTFFDGVSVVGTGALTNGQAKLATSLLPSGKHSLTAYYGGDSQYAPSTSFEVKQAVDPLPQNGFQAPINTKEGGQIAEPTSLVTADFNQDGRPDVALIDDYSEQLIVMPGNGDGTFGAAVFSYSNPPTSLTVGDFNGDGKTDIAIPDAYGPLTVLLGTGDGTFQTALTYPYQTARLVAADFNGDGKIDLTDGVSILIGNGDGSFQPPVIYNTVVDFTPPLLLSQAPSVAVGDFNGDGKADLALINSVSGNNLSILLGNGDGTFRSSVLPQAGNQAGPIIVGDFNGDSKADLAIGNVESKEVTVLLGNGDGTFQNPVNYPAGSIAPSIVTQDFNGDGNADLAVLNSSASAATLSIGVLLGNGDGTFQPPAAVPIGNGLFASNFVVADFNGDSRADIALGTYSSPQVSTAGFVTTLLGNPSTQPQLTIRTSPDGLLASVDGGAARQSPFTVSLPAGSHTVTVSATQSPVSGTQYVFTGWSDRGALSHSITIGTNSVSLLADFKTQYQVTTVSSPAEGGTVTPPSGTFEDAGSVVPFNATAKAGFYLTGFSGALSGSVVPQELTVNGPVTVVGNFASGAAPVIVPQISGIPGANGWYLSDVTVTWNVAGSSIVSSSGCSKMQLTAETAGQTLTCSATNGAGLTTTEAVTVKIDKTPPIISGMPGAGCTVQPPDGRLVSVALVSANDNLSGLVPHALNVNATSSQNTNSVADPDFVIAPDGNGDIVVELRAESAASHTGPITYTVSAAATDRAGNRTNVTTTCIEP